LKTGARRALRRLPSNANRPNPGFAQAPKGVVLETPEQIGQNAAKVAETVANRYMPIGNLTQMTDEERAIVAAWFAQGGQTLSATRAPAHVR
jgi:uncharacterized membrane protein